MQEMILQSLFEMEKFTSFMSQLLLIWQRSKISFYAFLSLVFLCLLAYNGATIFCVNVPFPAKTPPEYVPTLPSYTKLLSATVLPNIVVRKNQSLTILKNRSIMYGSSRKKLEENVIEILPVKKQFEGRVKNFFKTNSCKFRFFMTWISSAESLGEREMLAVESVFKTHPKGCLIMASSSLDSPEAKHIFTPLSERGFKATAIAPDFSYLLRNTAAAAWYKQLKRGKVEAGEIPLGQNLSNLLRMGLLYRFGGIYLDTDVLVLKSFGALRNAIGAQSSDVATGNWSRLNNAVMVFDKGHPLLREFIEEFAATFDGNRWGHNGPYLVSRVVARAGAGDVTVLPPLAFYPVSWNRIAALFHGPTTLAHSKWIAAKLQQIRSRSFALHLWNKQSSHFEVEKGSIIQQLMFTSTVITNSSASV